VRKVKYPPAEGYLLAHVIIGSPITICRDLGDAYCPVLREIRVNARGIPHRVTRSAFGAYFWIAVDARPQPDHILARFRTIYREGFYHFDGSEIDAMRDNEADWPVVTPDTTRIHRYRAGTPVLATAGPLVGRYGTVDVDRGDAVRVDFAPNFLRVWMPPEYIAQANACVSDKSVHLIPAIAG
jgi:hypothetical protein